VSTEPPTLDLTGYQRLRDLERGIARSPAGIALLLLTCMGLGVLGYGLFGLMPEAAVPRTGFGTPLAGFILFVAGLRGLRTYQAFRLARLRCPCCGRGLAVRTADVPEVDRLGLLVHRIDGRSYGHPRGDEHDTRPWVRLLKEVRACEPCRTYLDCSRLQERTCTDEDLERIRRRFPNDERNRLRQDAWGKALALIWSVLLLAGFFLFWWWSVP
jgi:hypothetical protein